MCKSTLLGPRPVLISGRYLRGSLIDTWLLAVLLPLLVTHGQKCEEGHFACPSGNCISSVWLCDGQKDCEDGADEFQCGKQAILVFNVAEP